MVNVCNQDLIAGLKLAGHAQRQLEIVGGGVLAEGDLLRITVEEIRKGLPGPHYQRVALHRGFKDAVCIGISAEQVVVDLLNHAQRHLSSPGAV